MGPVIQRLSAVLLALASWNTQAMDLRVIIESAIQTHPSTQAQRALREGAAVDVRTARQQFLPTPSVSIDSVQANPSDPIYRGNATVQTYRLQQPLWTGGRLSAGLDKAQAFAQAAEFAHEEAAQQLALRAVQAWGEWHSASLKAVALQASEATHQRLYEQVQRRLAHGASAAVELELTEGRLAQTRAQVQAVQAQLRSARLKVAQLIGEPVEAQPPRQSLRYLVPEPALLEEQVLQRSPTLLKQLAQMQAQQAELSERRAELWPEVYLRVERMNSHYDSTTMSSIGVTRYSIGLNTRLGAGLSTLTALESFERRMEAAQAELESNRRNLREQVQTDWEQWRSLQTRIPALQRSLQATQATAEAWDRQFLAGRKSWLEVMNTARELMQAELELADAQSAQIQLTWRLALLSLGWKDTLSAAAAAPAPEPTALRP